MRIEKFSAEWCGPCKVLAPIVDKVKEEFPQHTVVAIDIEEDPTLATARGVRSVPTMMAINSNGTIISVYKGPNSETSIRAWFKALP